MQILKCWLFLFFGTILPAKLNTSARRVCLWGTTHLTRPPCLTRLQWTEGWHLPEVTELGRKSPRKGSTARPGPSLEQRVRVGGNTQRFSKDSAAAWVRSPTGSLVTLGFFLSTCCPITGRPQSCPQLSANNPAAHCLPQWAVNTNAFLPAGPRGLPSNKGVRSRCGDSPATSNGSYQITGHRNLMTKHSAPASRPFCPPGSSQVLDVALQGRLLPSAISQVQELRHRELQHLAQSHTANTCENEAKGI